MLIARVRCDGEVRFGLVQGEDLLLLKRGALGVDQTSPLGVATLASVGWRDGDPLPTEGSRRIGDVDLLAPVPRPEKIVGIGLNYRKHAEEGGLPVPDWPEVFAKFPNAIADPGCDVAIPASDAEVDYEVELCVVIGQRGKQLRAGSALDVVAGYTVANDVSARKWQLRVSQWVSGKTSDGFCPLGPWIATPLSVPDPQALRLWTEVNGERVQDSSTADMVVGVEQLLVYLSSLMTLEAGDLILTGTPEGVGFGMKPPRFLKHGDVVAVGIDGIGVLSNTFVDPSTPTRW